MDIRIVRMTNQETCFGLEEGRVMSVLFEEPRAPIPFTPCRLFLYHVKENLKEEILPELPKYEVGRLFFGEKQKNSVYFFTIQPSQVPQEGIFKLCRYNIETGTHDFIYVFSGSLEEYHHARQLTVGILNNHYLLLQEADFGLSPSGRREGYFHFRLQLLDIRNQVFYPVEEEFISQYGIMSIIPIATNVCAIKIGYSLALENDFSYVEKADCALELTGLVTITQFISDIMMKNNEANMEIVDQCHYQASIPYMEKQGSYLIYSRIRRMPLLEELVFYNFVTKESIVCRNESYAKDLKMARAFILNKTPYILHEKEDYLALYNFSQNQVELQFKKGVNIQAIEQNLIITTFDRTGLLKKSRHFYEMYQYPNMSLLSRGPCRRIQCISTSKKYFYLFVY